MEIQDLLDAQAGDDGQPKKDTPLKSLKVDLDFYSESIKEIAVEIMAEGLSAYPIFVAHQHEVSIGELILKNLRAQGLETPLQQKRLVEAWPEVMGEMIASYTQDLFIKNQTLHVRLTNPALRADLAMMRPEIVKKLNAAVGSKVLVDIRFS